MFHLLGHAAPWMVLFLGLAGTLWAWRALDLQEQAFRAGRLDGAMAQTREAVDHRVEEQTKLLIAAKGFVLGRSRVTSEDWRIFNAGLEPRRLSPGTRVMGYLSREVLEGRKDALPLLEPEIDASLLGPQGSGLLRHPAFLDAATRARDRGEFAVSGCLVLPGEQAPSVAFLLPVFREGLVPNTTAARQGAFQGLVLLLAGGKDLFRTMYGAIPIADLDVEIYDDPSCREDGLIYDRALCHAGRGPAMAVRHEGRHMPLRVGGRQWDLVAGFVPGVAGFRESRPTMVALGGAALSLLAFGLTLFLAYSRSRLEAMAHQLRESEARFRSVAETASCAIFIYADHIEYMNEAGTRITGFSLEEILGHSLLNLVHPDDRELVRSRARARLRGDTVPLRYEFRLQTKSGEVRWIDFAAGTVVLGDRVLGLGTAFDVTERVKANEARLKAERKLMGAQKLESLGLLAGGVAHDFNNLLTVIQGNAGMLRDAMDEPEMAQTCLRNIEETCRRAAGLVGQMLAYSGRGRGQVHLLDLNRLIQEIAQLLSVSIPKAISIQYRLTDPLPPILGDPAQLQQVVMNLVTNAAEAIGETEGRITLGSGFQVLGETDATGLRVAEGLDSGPFVFFEVEDTGAGMDAATLARIFDPFFTTKFTGRGLGLAAMQGIVRGHGGGVEIQSSPGVGTTFRVYLPARSGSVLPGADEPRGAALPLSGEGLVLVADDEPGIRDFVQQVMVRAGFEVIVAADGVDAVEQVRAHHRELRLVLLDLTMPRLGGDEALVDIRALGYSGPVIRWSGYALTDATPDPRAAFLRKPFSAEELLALVAKALSPSVS
ncbi:PAS domain S-box protein [Geothrix sp. PMB-07]|uniref:PAS domain S-box protein n=1 Tax=Geothrix sp. PMB-07 TaxID=3068640 RepID=UPI0027419941|nr:PAS domain S-box protein [Geothrix sp. PMB-07]WLT32047.1 PAS domain S-box protein [Geothrix sp. PMB-07]